MAFDVYVYGAEVELMETDLNGTVVVDNEVADCASLLFVLMSFRCMTSDNAEDMTNIPRKAD